MDKLMNTPWFVKIISLVLAVLLFLIVTTETTPGDRNNSNVLPQVSETEEIYNVPIATHTEGPQYVVSDEAQTADIYLEGPTSVIRATLNQQNFEVFVDVTGLEPGTHEVDVQYSGFSNRLNVTLDPAQINVTIEPEVSNVYPVSIDYINQGNMAEGYSAGDAIVQPDSVRVTGPQSEMERIALVKTWIDLANISETFQSNALVKVYDQRGNELDVTVEPSSVEVEVPVAAPSKTVPIEAVGTGDAAEGFEVSNLSPTPQQVTISGPQNVLDGIERIQTEGIDLSGIDSSDAIEIGLDLPESITADPETVTVDVTVDEIPDATVQVPEVQVQAENAPEGEEIAISAPQGGVMNVSATGAESILSGLTNEDIIVIADLSGLGQGTHEVPLQVTPVDGIAFTLPRQTAVVTIGTPDNTEAPPPANTEDTDAETDTTATDAA
ncbi:CdaR family protein [Aureibacillus halotolerans]|uniref:YbbR domain-containing protein n=1 Tax=Aureibacillus halotolerans TaxID=1508390 RepID=A0A4R6U7I9_9BACI|nr:CdaR family protein [Aureibacillus halotolerans]TDQ40699.1 YbbR domain-containing protein [Aureibacillus halotolerans]